MVEEQKIRELLQVHRIFEQPANSISFYCDYGAVLRTENEIIIQFYETIPGAPDPGGSIASATSRLRATIALSLPHAQNIGKLLFEKAKELEK